jgi:hypothetical protein
MTVAGLLLFCAGSSKALSMALTGRADIEAFL